MKKRLIAGIVLLTVLLLANGSMAADGYNAQLFWPSIFGGNFLAIEDAHTLCPLGFGAGLYMNYADGPVEVRIDDDLESGVLNQLFTADLTLAFGPFSWWAVGVDVPVHLMARAREFGDIEAGQDASGLTSDTTLGDIRAEFKFRLLRQELHWLGMAIAPYATFPTGDETMFLGEGRVTGGGNLILERDFEILNVALNGGYLYRGDSDLTGVNVGDAWKMGAGVSREFKSGLSFSVEYWSSWVDSGSVERFQANPMEVMGTCRYRFGESLPRVVGGAGAGLTSGVGSPAYRLVGGVDYAYCQAQPTKGKLDILVVNEKDEPLEAGIEILGPSAHQTKTDEKGRWRSTVSAGEYLIYASKPGYSQDSRKAAVQLGKTTKLKLKLVKQPTTLQVTVTDKFTGQKLNATVIFDMGTDKETTWKLPNGQKEKNFEPGKYKIIASAKGYEDKFTSVTVKKDQANQKQIKLRKKIEKIGNIYFDYDSDVIRKESYPVLDDVVEKINSLEKYKKILIQGHCSSEGTDEYNMDLSTRRSTSVKKYLIAKGIEGAKLEIDPYGESRPIATNETEQGRAKNRRVEFIIEE